MQNRGCASQTKSSLDSSIFQAGSPIEHSLYVQIYDRIVGFCDCVSQCAGNDPETEVIAADLNSSWWNNGDGKGIDKTGNESADASRPNWSAQLALCTRIRDEPERRTVSKANP